jgi:hypothetical protein
MSLFLAFKLFIYPIQAGARQSFGFAQTSLPAPFIRKLASKQKKQREVVPVLPCLRYKLNGLGGTAIDPEK